MALASGNANATFDLLLAARVMRITTILAHPGVSCEQLARAVAELENVWKDTVELTGGMYQPKYVI
jgi:hypothetical protein